MNEARKKCYRRTHSLCLLLIIHVNKKWTKNIFEKRNELKIYTNLFLKNFFAVLTWSIYSFKYAKFTKFCGVLNLENVRGLSPETKLGVVFALGCGEYLLYEQRLTKTVVAKNSLIRHSFNKNLFDNDTGFKLEIKSRGCSSEFRKVITNGYGRRPFHMLNVR